MKNPLITTFLLVVTLAAAQQNTEPAPHAYLVRMTESQMWMHPTAGPNTVSNCLVAYPNGRLHLELRRQERFDGHAALATYELTLRADELGVLRRLLESSSVKQLKPYVVPAGPMVVDEAQSFEAEIPRELSLQEVGYFSWRGEGPKNSEADKKAWQDAGVTLKPLIEWFRAAKSSKSLNWHQVENPDSVCGE